MAVIEFLGDTGIANSPTNLGVMNIIFLTGFWPFAHLYKSILKNSINCFNITVYAVFFAF